MASQKITGASLSDETTLQRVAHIMGAQSSSQKVLNELARRRADGEDVVAYDVETAAGKVVLVGPPIDGSQHPEG